jgi:hypothetical protein
VPAPVNGSGYIEMTQGDWEEDMQQENGDLDYAGNAAYLREEFGARIAMHHADSGMVERGDMFWNRNRGMLYSG